MAIAVDHLAATVDGPLRGRDLLQVEDLDEAELVSVLDLADRLKALQREHIPHHLLPGRTLGMIFEKSSTRTRVSFEVGMTQLGGSALFLKGEDMQTGRGETVRDTGIVLSRYLDGIMIRARSHADVEQLAAAATVPVINGLTDLHHPVQALADLQVMRERLGDLAGRTLVWLGDGGDNVCRSLITAASTLGMRIVLGCPDGYLPDPAVLDAVDCEIARDPQQAVAVADAIATDVWVSMGQESERERRLADLAGFQVNESLLAHAPSGHILLHCLPAHYGEEVTEQVLHGPTSVVWDEAENRLHTQKALLALTLP
ncbi:MAG TPA: ornithine carbamoyltransferase [Gaiellales bacterium]|nr:ornithine carbamoyltransferase [Gaiellales bacterium]